MENPIAKDLATRLFKIHMDINDKLLEAQDFKKDYADKFQKAHPMINIRNKVWLLCCNLKINHPCDKLDFCRLRFFSVIKQINDVIFCLIFPILMKIHPIFYVSLFELYKKSSILGKF